MQKILFISTLLIAVIVYTPHAHAQRVSNIYRFYNNLSTTETDCAEDLVPAMGLTVTCKSSTAATEGEFIGDTIFNIYRKVYHNNLNWGLKYLNTGGVVAKTYTVQMYIKVTNFNDDYTRIVDFSNGIEDDGIYFTNVSVPLPAKDRCLNFYPNGNFGPCPFFNNHTYYLLTITRNDLTKNIDIYVNDQLFTSYQDDADFYTSAARKPVYIFRDDPVGYACEDGEANFAYLSFSNFYSTQPDVAYVYQNINVIANSSDFSITPALVCTGNNVTVSYTGNTTPAPGQFSWSWDGANIISGNGAGPYTVNWATAGNKTINLTIPGACANTAILNTKQVAVNTTPAPYLGTANIICPGDSLVLNPGVFDSYLWQDGSTKSTYTAKKTGLYSVTVANNCGTADAQLQVNENNCDVYFPTAFTPNGDNNNDFFKMLNGYAVKDYKLAVYNRFGQKVFETTDVAKGWNGTFNGKRQMPGTYVWYCAFTLHTVAHQLKGTVVLIR